MLRASERTVMQPVATHHGNDSDCTPTACFERFMSYQQLQHHLNG